MLEIFQHFSGRFLKGKLVKQLNHQGSNLPFSLESTVAIQIIFTALSVFYPARVQKDLNFQKRNFILVPCLELEYMPSLRGCWCSSEVTCSKANTDSMGKPHQYKKEMPRPKAWAQVGKSIGNTWAALRLFPGRRHVDTTTKSVCEEKQ